MRDMGNRISQFDVDKLGRYVEIFPGFAFKSERFTADPADVALVKGENVQQGFVDWGSSKYWPIADADLFSKFELRVGDVVLAMDRPWVTAGLKWAYIKTHDPRALLVQRVSRLRAKKGLNQTYLRCLISSGYFSDYIQPIVTGVNIPHISGKQIGDFKIPLPPLPIQQKIAAILSAYDDVIENNQRRIALLEKMAEEIYREWFVRLRFPGYEKVTFVKGVPEGWGRTKVATLTSYLKRGVAPQYDDLAEGLAINQKCIRDGKLDLDFARHQSKDVPADRQVRFGDVLVNSTGEGTLGRVAQVLVPIPNCIVDSHVTIVRPKPNVPIHYFGMTLKAWEVHFITMGRGATNQTELAPSVIGGVEVTVPSKPLQDTFESHAGPLFAQITHLTAQNERLVRTRDLLLPRLISGKLSVENLDIQFPLGMEESAYA